MKRVSRLTMEEILTVTITVQILIIIKTTFDYSALKKKKRCRASTRVHTADCRPPPGNPKENI